MERETCPTCGLPYPECNALAVARKECEKHLREEGYSLQRAKARSADLAYQEHHL